MNEGEFVQIRRCWAVLGEPLRRIRDCCLHESLEGIGLSVIKGCSRNL